MGCLGNGLFVAAFRDRICFHRDPIGDFVHWLPATGYMVFLRGRQPLTENRTDQLVVYIEARLAQTGQDFRYVDQTPFGCGAKNP